MHLRPFRLAAAAALATAPAALGAWALTELFPSLFDRSTPDRALVLALVWIVTTFGLAASLPRRHRRHRRPPPPRPRRKLATSAQPWVLDTSVVIDGRIADLVATGWIDHPLVVPQFVIDELQGIADSSDKQRRARGRRGLDVLHRLKSSDRTELRIDDRQLREYADQPVDRKLVALAKDLDGCVATHDFNLNQVARLQGVRTLNLNEAAAALRPPCLPGETLVATIVRLGEQPGQGVGYLDDGTMIVVEGGHDHLQQSVTLRVTGVTQSAAGRMIFGRFESAADEEREEPQA